MNKRRRHQAKQRRAATLRARLMRSMRIQLIKEQDLS